MACGRSSRAIRPSRSPTVRRRPEHPRPQPSTYPASTSSLPRRGAGKTISLEDREGWRALQLLDASSSACRPTWSRHRRHDETVREASGETRPTSPQSSTSERPSAWETRRRPFALGAAGNELTLHEPPSSVRRIRERLGDRHAEAESPRERVWWSGPCMRARKRNARSTSWVTDRLEQGLGNARWQ